MMDLDYVKRHDQLEGAEGDSYEVMGRLEDLIFMRQIFYKDGELSYGPTQGPYELEDLQTWGYKLEGAQPSPKEETDDVA